MTKNSTGKGKQRAADEGPPLEQVGPEVVGAEASNVEKSSTKESKKRAAESDPSLKQPDLKTAKTKTSHVGNGANEHLTELDPASIANLDPDTEYPLEGQRYIESFKTYIMNEKRALQWVSQGGGHHLCTKTTAKPAVLKFWITGHVKVSYLRAERQYNDYTVQLEVTDEVMAKIHEFLRCGPHGELADEYQSPLRMKARIDDVKRIADKNTISLPGVYLPLPEKADFPLVFDATTLSATTPRPIPGGEPLTRLGDLPFVAMETWVSAWKIQGNPTYTFYFDSIRMLGNESMWDDEVTAKGSGPMTMTDSSEV